jgi:DNA-binding transcriptional LysR family regulator
MGKGEVVIVPEFDGARPREPAEVTLRKLQAFWAVAHAGSLTRAARLMGVTQPSLSQQMAGFEALVGSPLFDRRSNVMHLTEVGRRLLDRAEPVLRALRDFETELASLQGAPRTMLRIAGIGSAITMLVPGAAAVLAETCASPEYDLVEASPSDVLELLNVRRADLGLVAANSLAENAKGFKEVAILSDQHFLIAPKALNLDAVADPEKDLSEADYALLQRTVEFAFGTPYEQRLRLWFDRVIPGGRTVARSRSYEAVVEMVRAGMGVAVVPGLSILGAGGAAGLRLYQTGLPLRRIVALMATDGDPLPARFAAGLVTGAQALSLPEGQSPPPFLQARGVD